MLFPRAGLLRGRERERVSHPRATQQKARSFQSLAVSFSRTFLTSKQKYWYIYIYIYTMQDYRRAKRDRKSEGDGARRNKARGDLNGAIAETAATTKRSGV